MVSHLPEQYRLRIRGVVSGCRWSAVAGGTGLVSECGRKEVAMSVLAAVAVSARQYHAAILTDQGRGAQRLTRRVPETVRYVDHPLFHEVGVEGRLFGCQAQPISVPRWRHFSQLPEEGSPVPRARTGLSHDDQAQLFLRYNYAKYRLSKLLARRPGRRGVSHAEEVGRWHGRVLEGRSNLVEANMALVVAMAKRTRIANVDFEDLMSEGSMALLRSVETFDLSRGHKLSTYACRSILKSFNRLATKTGRYYQRFPTDFDPDLERSDYNERRHEMQRDNSVEDLRDMLVRNRAQLSETELAVVMERFAIGFDGKGRTLREVGQLVGVTAERVRQIQQYALGKLRKAMAEKPSTP